MREFQLSTPVTFIIFNRPDTTARVFEAIRQARPPRLLVVADGPRSDHPEDVEKCAATRAVIERVDWDCEILTNFTESNMGCKHRVSSGLDWVFETVEEAIILEDDCLPHPTFFRFCEELLDYYRDDTRIMAINGTNILGKWKVNIQSYHFSYYGGIWGWATWRRAWRYYDVNMKLWSKDEIKARVKDVIADEVQYKFREKLFDIAYGGKIDTWDYQWLFARFIQSGLSITPALNLVSNIGFGEEATHTKSSNDSRANLKTCVVEFPLKKPDSVAVDRAYDKALVETIFSPDNMMPKLKKVIPKLRTVLRKTTQGR